MYSFISYELYVLLSIIIVSEPTIDSSVTIIQSSTISIQMSETSISSLSSRIKQETVTVTVSSCSVSADVPVEGAVTGNTTAAGLAGAVVPLLVIIIILVTVLIFLLVLIYKRRRNHSENTRYCVVSLSYRHFNLNCLTLIGRGVNH